MTLFARQNAATENGNPMSTGKYRAVTANALYLFSPLQ